MQFAFVDAAADPAGSQKCCRNGLRYCRRHSPAPSNSGHSARPPAHCPPARRPPARRPGRPAFFSCAAAARPLTHAPPPSPVRAPLHPPLFPTPIPVCRILVLRAPPCGPRPSLSLPVPVFRPSSSPPDLVRSNDTLVVV